MAARRGGAATSKWEHHTNRFRLGGYLSWALAYAATYKLIASLGVDTWWMAALAAGAVQYLFTQMEGPFVAGDRDFWGGLAFGLDTLTNAGGMFIWVLNISNTEFWQFANFVQGESPNAQAGRYVIALICLGLGAVLAAAPEVLFEKAHRYMHGLHTGTRIVKRDRFIDDEGREVNPEELRRQRERGRDDRGRDRGRRQEKGRQEKRREGGGLQGVADRVKAARQRHQEGRDRPVREDDEDEVEEVMEEEEPVEERRDTRRNRREEAEVVSRNGHRDEELYEKRS